MRRTLLPLVLAVLWHGLSAMSLSALLWHGLPTVPLGPTAGLLADELPVPAVKAPAVSTDAKDWPTYNHDFLGTRHNPAEKTLSRENVGQLVEKWRFPPADSSEKIGVVHATVVVNGHVYFGTETTPAFYKLTPDGKV